MNYSDLGDYIEIIKKYNRIFSNGNEELNRIINQLTTWYNFGRNLIMHSRPLNIKKYYVTKAAIDYLQEWIRRHK